jgi:hypothetical protein
VQNKLRQSQNVICCCWFWHERANYHLWKLRIIFSISFCRRRPTSDVLHHPKLQNIFRWHYHLQNHPIFFISYCYDAQIKNERCTSNTTNNNKKCSLRFSRKQPMWQIQWQIGGLFCKGPYRSRVIQFLLNTVKWQASVSRVMNRWLPLQQNTSSPTTTVWRKKRHHTIICCLLPNSPQWTVFRRCQNMNKFMNV